MFTKKTLENKIRYLMVPQKGTNTITLMVMVKVGSRYETQSLAGASHYIEHLMFKGTKKRPSTLVLSKALDAIGAEFNAFTGKEYTAYYIKCNKKYFKKIVDILFDMINNSLFDEEEMEREKNVIVEEINMYNDNPLFHIDEMYDQIIYKGNTLADDIAGTKESVLNFKRNDVLGYKKNSYASDNIVVVMSGKLTKRVEDIFQSYFADYENISKAKTEFEVFKQDQSEPVVNLEYKDMGQVQIQMGFIGLPYGHKDLPALKLLSIILGGNMSSRLFISIRERKGLCYAIKSSVDVYQDTGSLKVKAGLHKGSIFKAIKYIKKELETIAQKGVTKAELKKAKDYLEGKLTINLEDSFELGVWYGMQELYNEPIKTPKEKMEEYFQVTPEDILRVAKLIIDMKKINLAVLGPFKDQKEFSNILKD